MAQIGDTVIVDREEYLSGGAFRLEEIPKSSNMAAFDGWRVELEEENPYAVVRTQRTIAERRLVETLYEHLQRGLDILSIQNDGDLRCQELHTERIVAWSEGGDQLLRVVGIADVTMNTSASATVRDEEGNIVERDSPETEWHESLRFFRLSQSTDDLFDAYRNAFLALETLLSDRTPKSPDEGESKWLKRALSDAQNEVDLGNFAPNPSAPVESIHGYQYENTRCEMFHSKITEPSLVPHRVEDREQVQDALNDLLRMYVSILRETININRGSGVVTNKGFELMTQWLKNEHGVKVVLSSDNTPFDPSESLDSEPWNDNTQITGSYSDEYSNPGETCVLADWNLSESEYPTPIHRVGLINIEEDEQGLISSTRIESGLSLNSIDIFQCLKGLRLNNANTVKTRFIA